MDANQAEVVAALRGAGCSVALLHAVGGGVPDLAVGRRGVTYLLEVKMPRGPRTPGPEPLTPDQVEWHVRWTGHVAVVTTPEEALEAVGLL